VRAIPLFSQESYLYLRTNFELNRTVALTGWRFLIA
jgi:hypothetical protein